jgi:hypothetical protein
VKIKQKLIYRCVAQEHMLIPVGDVPDAQNGLFVLSEWGAFIWQLLEQGKEKEEILTAILDEYDVDEQTARTDLEEYLQMLITLDVIE